MTRGKKGISLAAFLIGIIFTCAGLTITYYMGKDLTLSCQRSSDICVIEEQNVLGETVILEKFKLRKLAGAEIISSKTSDGNDKDEVMLIINQKRIPLSDYMFNSSKSNTENIQSINNYVKSKEEDFNLVQSGKITRILGYILAETGILFIFSALIPLFNFVVCFFLMLIKRK